MTTDYQREREALRDEWFQAAAAGPRTHYVYRYYAADDSLVYVGMTMDPESRHRNHKNSADWFALAPRRELRGPMPYWAAQAFEWEALTHEGPSHNIKRGNGYKGPGSIHWITAEAEDFRRRCDADPEFEQREMRAELERFGDYLDEIGLVPDWMKAAS